MDNPTWRRTTRGAALTVIGLGLLIAAVDHGNPERDTRTPVVDVVPVTEPATPVQGAGPILEGQAECHPGAD